MVSDYAKSYLSHLECAWCHTTYEANQLINLCPVYNIIPYDGETVSRSKRLQSILFRGTRAKE